MVQIVTGAVHIVFLNRKGPPSTYLVPINTKHVAGFSDQLTTNFYNKNGFCKNVSGTKVFIKAQKTVLFAISRNDLIVEHI